MIEVNLRNKNNLIILSVVGKTPIRGKVLPSPYFHNPIELLLSALGLCVGGIVVNYCRMNDLNVSIFENIRVFKDGCEYIINILCPKDLDLIHKNRLETEINDCPVSRHLKDPTTIIWGENKTPTIELLKEKEQPCCGSK